ncbi:MAG: hypothetical protein LGR52_04680 [Candidatus Thiosymbion ectosymbiont of Robbea hypermnestra]|nr:hypothetical protein [Candidatus Thiosymbion ectosymbiont of Robbea hypermnestra]
MVLKRIFSVLFSVLLWAALVVGSGAVSAREGSLDSWYDQLANGAEPRAVAARFPARSMTDLRSLNALRLRLKADDKGATARTFFAALAEREPSDAVLLNLSLTYVDQMAGKNLLRQGYLSTRSQRTVERIIERDADHWVAWYIRGLNNLYWPDWFRKAPLAREYLTEAVAIHQRLSPSEQGENDRYALGYLALGDAYALLDEPAEARRAWTDGLRFYPYVTALRERSGVADGELHAAVRDLRDANKPIDTDLAFMWSHRSAPFEIVLTGGTLFGPGPLEDQPLHPGGLVDLRLGGALTGFIPAFNNGPEEPNLPGELRQGKVVDGLLSDGTEANEKVDVGFVRLMDGRFNLFLAAIQDGPNAGKVNFFLDSGWHWTIRDDIGIDPGFPVGVVKFNEFVFSTGPRVLPLSRQTEAGAPAGMDRAGSLESGGVAPGALGDDDFDGKLDGTFNAIGRFPYDSVILPGAPFAQTRVFETDIPVTSGQAALLTVANGLSYLRLAFDVQGRQPALAEALRETFRARMGVALRHAEDASPPGASLSDRAHATMARLGSLTSRMDETMLCEGWRMLRDAMPENGLYRRGFDGTGVEVCSR